MTALVRLLAVGLAALTLAGSAEAARVPSGVASILIRSAAGVTASVTSPRDVAQIVKWFDALPLPTPRGCPGAIEFPPDVSFTFRSSGGAALLQAVDHEPGSCDASVTYGTGRRPLADDGFVARVSRLLGVDFNHNPRTAANERAATRDTATILRLAVLPAGSSRLAKASRTLGDGSTHYAPTFVYRYTLWRVHKRFRAAKTFVRTHPPRGARRLDVPGCCGHVGADLEFSFPPAPGRISSRVLSVELAPLTHAHGWTGMRVYVSDVWVAARGPDEKVPAGARAIVVRDSHKGFVHRFTSRAQVARIVRWFDALPLVQPSFSRCPLLRGPRVTLSFLGAHGSELAQASTNYVKGVTGPCNPVEFRIGPFAEQPLVGGRLFGRVERLGR